MMYQGFAGEYEAPSSRCSSASPAGDSLTYYPSPADSFSSMGSPVNSQPLGAGSGGELEPLCTPVVTCTPCPSTYTSTFVFTYPEADAFPSCAAAHRKGSSSNEPSSDSLSSPTLLAL
ncbi:hypothetical protein CIB84_014166 [Bambusicola thoracicus]|uniref:Uncharacterized protein n=1 Tax=Bambusicola thoracicus TaxID=9083 RepID=A0A2P4SDA4_BAMTH|nr:hypothetical protein CIB84_014166 [Bambusicola thoracicus]